jgi:circadian clock protein KaiB
MTAKSLSANFTMETNNEKLLLQLYITTHSTSSHRAVKNLIELLEAHFKGQYELEIVDIKKMHSAILSEDIIAVPLLIKKSPLPVSKLIGDMSDKAAVLRRLGSPPIPPKNIHVG